MRGKVLDQAARCGTLFRSRCPIGFTLMTHLIASWFNLGLGMQGRELGEEGYGFASTRFEMVGLAGEFVFR